MSAALTPVNSSIALFQAMNYEVVQLLTTEPYKSNMQGLAGYLNFSVWVTGEKVRVGLTVTDKYLSLGLFKKDTNLYDSSSDLFSRDPRAVEWGEKLFRFYKERSVQLDIVVLFKEK